MREIYTLDIKLIWILSVAICFFGVFTGGLIFLFLGLFIFILSFEIASLNRILNVLEILKDYGKIFEHQQKEINKLKKKIKKEIK